jgi:hypothetical protein
MTLSVGLDVSLDNIEEWERTRKNARETNGRKDEVRSDGTSG